MPDTLHATDPGRSREPLALKPPRHRVERRAILLWTLYALIWGITVVGGLAALYAFLPAARPWLTPALWILPPIYLLYLTAVPRWRYRVHRWEITDEAVYALSGWVVREWRIVPVSRIQSIDTKKGPLQSWLNLATLKVSTAAASEGGISIIGLDAGVAEECSRRLTDLTQSVPGDAT